MAEENQRISLPDAAKQMKTTPLNVLMHIKRGLIEGFEVDGEWQVDAESLSALLEKTDGGKAQDVCASGCSKRHNCGSGCG
ncbi:MAG: hypothetical protein C0616_12255 [Desulfuromonas sp.]|nr:MAG: hypothetical protein C0616_12255 [Desulfuromonas sp.]